MYFYDPENRPEKEITAGIRTRTFWGEKVMLSLVNLDAYAELPSHSHPHEQISYILEGELEFIVGDQTRKVGSGEIVIIPGKVKHSVKVGPADAVVLDTFSPIREDFIY